MITKTLHQFSGLVAWGSSLICAALAFFSVAFTDRFGSLTGRVVGPIPSVIRAEFVASQAHVFWLVALFFTLLLGAGVAAFEYRTQVEDGRSIAAGRSPQEWGKVVAFWPLLCCFILGISLPKAVFQVTNPLELNRQFLLGFISRSLLGGAFLGLLMGIFAWIFAQGFFALGVTLPRHHEAKKYGRLLE